MTVLLFIETVLFVVSSIMVIFAAYLPWRSRFELIIRAITLVSIDISLIVFDTVDFLPLAPRYIHWIIARDTMHGAIAGTIGGIVCDLLLLAYTLVSLKTREPTRFMLTRIFIFASMGAVIGGFIATIPYHHFASVFLAKNNGQ